jgi:hypothetical protein
MIPEKDCGWWLPLDGGAYVGCVFLLLLRFFLRDWICPYGSREYSLPGFKTPLFDCAVG